MHIVKMKLVSRKSYDRLIEVKDDIPIGKIYTVDIDSIQEQTMFNTEKGKVHHKTMIFDVEADSWFPYDFLAPIGENDAKT